MFVYKDVCVHGCLRTLTRVRSLTHTHTHTHISHLRTLAHSPQHTHTHTHKHTRSRCTQRCKSIATHPILCYSKPSTVIQIYFSQRSVKMHTKSATAVAAVPFVGTREKDEEEEGAHAGWQGRCMRCPTAHTICTDRHSGIVFKTLSRPTHHSLCTGIEGTWNLT